MASSESDIGPVETLIGFKLDTFEAQNGHAVLVRLKLASSENGVRVAYINCGADWAKTLASSLAKASVKPFAATSPYPEEEQ